MPSSCGVESMTLPFLLLGMCSREASVAPAGSQGFGAPQPQGSRPPRLRRQSRKSAAPVAPAAHGTGADADSSPGGDDGYPSPGDEYVSSEVEQSPIGGSPPQQQQQLLRSMMAEVSYQATILFRRALFSIIYTALLCQRITYFS